MLLTQILPIVCIIVKHQGQFKNLWSKYCLFSAFSALTVGNIGDQTTRAFQLTVHSNAGTLAVDLLTEKNGRNPSEPECFRLQRNRKT